MAPLLRAKKFMAGWDGGTKKEVVIMAYIPTEWVTGDVITAERLNNIESGVENLSSTGVEYVTITASRDASRNVTASIDKTWNELLSLVESNVTVIAIMDLTLPTGAKYRAKTTLDVNIDTEGNVTSLGCSYISAHAGSSSTSMLIAAYHFNISSDSVTGDYSSKTI